MLDRISNLPWNALKNILGRIPIIDVVRTTILSKNWRDKWVDIPVLIFNSEETDSIDHQDDLFRKLVNHVLLSHRGKIENFSLETRQVPENEDVESWIHFLARCDIKKVILYLHEDYHYNWPSCLFTCKELKLLHFSVCALQEIPSSFTGFSSLVDLRLRIYNFDYNLLERLIRSCPTLETLGLSGFWQCKRFEIYAPKLKLLYLEGGFDLVYLETCPHLTDATFKMIVESENAAAGSGECGLQGVAHNVVLNLAGDPASLCQFERLTLSGFFLRILATGFILPKGVPITFDHLKMLELWAVSFDNLDEVSTALSILTSAFNLEELRILEPGAFDNELVYELMEKQQQSRFCFNQLRVVKLDINKEAGQLWRCIFELIKLVLACSSRLEEMHVQYECTEKYATWFTRKLLSLERASKYLEYKFSHT